MEALPCVNHMGDAVGAHTHTHIVVVSDNADFLEVMADLLHDPRYAATVVDGDRDNALELVRAAEPDGLIIDLRLGRDELHGWEILKQIRSDPELSDLPAVICSADVEALSSVGDALAGMRRIATISKPFAIDEMLATLEHILEREPA
jgi:two-component system, chemotaxis family, chemotaxis protein CheY